MVVSKLRLAASALTAALFFGAARAAVGEFGNCKEWQLGADIWSLSSNYHLRGQTKNHVFWRVRSVVAQRCDPFPARGAGQTGRVTLLSGWTLS